jgi:hypothetical protein
LNRCRSFEISIAAAWRYALDMNEDEIKARIQAALEHCRKLTVQLLRLSANIEDTGIASGFFIPVDGVPYLISAGHALEKNGWTIETSFTIEDKNLTACIPVGGAWLIKRLTTTNPKLQDMDIAWAKVDFDSFQKAVSADKRLKGKNFEYLIYQGPLDELPDAKDPHLYAASNRATLITALGKTYMERDFSYEYEMDFKGEREDGLYVFSVPKHKGHKYYKGASGSPIIEPSGKVRAILVSGCETKNELYGYPLKGVVNLIKVGIDVEKHQAADGDAAK